MSAGALIGIAAACVAYLALVPSYLFIVLGAPSTAGASPASPVSAADRAQIAEAQTLAAEFAPFAEGSSTPARAIVAAVSALPSGVSLSSVAYTRQSGVSGTLVLSGQASDPALIEKYREALAGEPGVSSAAVPVGALVGASGGSFSVTVIGDF